MMKLSVKQNSVLKIWLKFKCDGKTIPVFGFAYQIAFVRLAHRFPLQQPLEIVDELLTYVGVQLDIPAERSKHINNVNRP